jgi:hypothetical protein
MAPHGLEIEDHQALLGLGAGKKLSVPILPDEVLVFRPSNVRCNDTEEEREHRPYAQAHDLSPQPIDVVLATEGAHE